MQIARLAVAVCALLVLVGCGNGHLLQDAPSRSASPTAAAAGRSDHQLSGQVSGQVSEDARKTLGDGVVLTISRPRTFTPSDTAYPPAVRAVAFDLTIDNGGTAPYRPASLSFTATTDGQPTEQVIDSTQGYNGPSGATEEVAPGALLRIAVAFAALDEPCRLVITVRSEAASAIPVLLYDGTV